MMPRVLVTGSNGQLGSELRELADSYTGYIVFADREMLDISDRKSVEELVLSEKIDVIVNTAAYTAVDRAESDKENADRVNHLAVDCLSKIAKEQNLILVHISTDYVFDGKNHKPYSENDEANPQNIYGKTKLAGEKAFIQSGAKGLIIRTSWVYSSFGSNFVKTMLRLGREKESLGVVCDQIGTPTYAKDLAKAILDIIQNSKFKIQNSVEIYHYSNDGVLSWYDFAKEIMRMAKIECQINPIETKEYPTPAVRPYYSLLNKAKIKNDFDLKIPYWKDSLDECLKNLKERR